jgi:NAD(P)-dependent dehydrogenase (short-subunit alcohol dehydrogenase family)
MGKATAGQLAQMGARLLLVGRNRGKGEAASNEIIRASGNDGVTFLQAVLSLMRDVRRFAEQVRQRVDRLDVPAFGTMARKRSKTC